MQCRERQGGLREAAAAAANEGAEVDRSVQLSCGEHADYGLLTFVNQEDHVAALQAGAPVRLIWTLPLLHQSHAVLCRLSDQLTLAGQIAQCCVC